MKLFTVSEPVEGDGVVPPGIRIFPNELPMGLRWGSVAHDAMRVLPVSQAQYLAVKTAVACGLIRSDSACYLAQADIVKSMGSELHLGVERNAADQRALVYLCTSVAAQTRGGRPRNLPDDAVVNTVALTSNETRHVIEGTGLRARVRRVHRPFSEAVGVNCLDCALLEEDGASWSEALLILQSGASFRVVRGVEDVRDAAPEFLVTWNHGKLRTVVPERYRDRTDDATVP